MLYRNIHDRKLYSVVRFKKTCRYGWLYKSTPYYPNANDKERIHVDLTDFVVVSEI